MASDSLSIRDVGKRAPDLTGDTVKFDFSKTKTSRNLFYGVVSKSPDFVCEEVIVEQKEAILP